MKPTLIRLAGVLALGVAPAVALAAGPAPAPPAPAAQGALATPEARAAYAIGLNLGQRLRSDTAPVDPEVVAAGLRDGFSGAKPQVSPEDMQSAITQLQGVMQAQRQLKAAKAAEANRAEGAAFLKVNGAKPGVVTLPSGLQYEILKSGSGPKPGPDDMVSCNYRGTLINGTEFDSSYGRGAPSSFSVVGVIKGWTEALQLMPVGSKWRLAVPADLAYGDRGAGEAIGPGATLIFEVELLKIEGKS